jgi:hypothetical protein
MNDGEHALSLLQGSALQPSQWSDSPELRLIIAVFEDALKCIEGGANVGCRTQRFNTRRADDAAAWFASEATGVFSARWTCDALGIDIDALRGVLTQGTANPQHKRLPVIAEGRMRIRRFGRGRG